MTETINHWNEKDFPKHGWWIDQVIDTEEAEEICGMCGKYGIRHLFIVKHPTGLELAVGEICAGKLTTNSLLCKEYAEIWKKANTFAKSKQWKEYENGNLHRVYRGHEWLVFHCADGWIIKLDDEILTNTYETPKKAIKQAYMWLSEIVGVTNLEWLSPRTITDYFRRKETTLQDKIDWVAKLEVSEPKKVANIIWHVSAKGNLCSTIKGSKLTVFKRGNYWQIIWDNRHSKVQYSTIKEAINAIYRGLCK